MTDRVGVALVGYGYWGANLARNIRAVAGLELIGVADEQEGQRHAAVAAYPGIATWSSLEAALADTRVQAVVIAAPAAMHADLGRVALEGGRHVLIEKPFTTDPATARSLARTAEESGLVAMVGHTFLYSPPVWRLKEYLSSGLLGTPQYLYSQRLSLGRVRRDCNALWNFAPHDISIILYLLDELPTEVSATSIAMIDPAVPDVFFAKLQFPSGIGAHIHVSWLDPRKTRLLTVVGDEKMAVYDDVSVDRKLAVYDVGVARQEGLGKYESLGDFQWRTRAGDILIPHIEMSEPLRNEIDAFARACLGEGPPPSDGWEGVHVVQVLEAIDRSAADRGTPVALQW